MEDSNTAMEADLDITCKDLQGDLQALEARWKANQSAVVVAKDNLRLLKSARDKAVEAERKVAPALEALRGAAEEASRDCEAAEKALEALSANKEEGASEDADGPLPAALRRLAALQGALGPLRARLAAAEAARAEAEARAISLQELKEHEERSKVELMASLEQVRTAALQQQQDLQRAAAEAEASTKVEQARAAALEEVSAALRRQIESLQAELSAKATEATEAKAAAAEAAAAAAVATTANPAAQGAEAAAASEGSQAPAAGHGASPADALGGGGAEAAPTSAAEPAAMEVGETKTGARPTTSAVVVSPADPAPALLKKAARRLVVSAAGAPDLCGEYRLLEGAPPNGRPAYRAAGAKAPFLFWTPQEGGSWIFTVEMPSGGGPCTTQTPLARCLQVSRTSLPDELMYTSWTKAAFGTRGALMRVAVMRA